VTEHADHQSDGECGQRDVQMRLLSAAEKKHSNREPYI
jgi:hypothetical protein